MVPLAVIAAVGTANGFSEVKVGVAAMAEDALPRAMQAASTMADNLWEWFLLIRYSPLSAPIICGFLKLVLRISGVAADIIGQQVRGETDEIIRVDILREVLRNAHTGVDIVDELVGPIDVDVRTDGAVLLALLHGL